jgi:alkylation response protein AidB-like acyl-CoA dehydrogenase
MRQRDGLDTETLDAVLQTLTTVAERRLGKEVRLGLDERSEFPAELVQELLGPEVGLHLLFLPEEAGGLGGGARDLFRVSEEMARVDLGVATAFLAIALGVDPIVVGGTEAQRTHWLARIADEGLIVAYGVTEAAAGSNVANLATVARPVLTEDGSLGAYRLNGTKQFISNGGVAQLYTILAKTDGGPSFFVIERETPGLSVGPSEHKHGIRASNTTQVILDDVEVPADHLLGEQEGEGLHQANRVFGYTRLMVAAFGLGAGEEALQRAIVYATEREQFGEPLIAKQGFTHKLLVPHLVRLEAARAYVVSVAERLDNGEEGLQVEGAIAKLFATEAGNAAADAALQAHGGYGYTHEYEVEKIRRDVRITTIYEGTSEIQQSIIGTNRWRSTVRSKGAFYRDMAAEVRELDGPGCALTADAVEALAETVLTCHSKRLPKEQYVLFELARLMAEAETAVELVRAAASRDEAWYAACARLHARAVARDVAVTGQRLLIGTNRLTKDELAVWRAAVRNESLLAAASGELADLNTVAAALTEWRR